MPTISLLERPEPINQVDRVACVSIAWTELLRVAGRVALTPDDALVYASTLHDETASQSPRADLVEAVGEALRRRGVIAGMLLVASADELLDALAAGPIVACLPWRHGVLYPRSGVVVSITGDGEVDDGCELLHCHVLVARHERLERRGCSRATDVVEFRASIGRRWGMDGVGYLKVGDLRTLLAYTRDLPGFGFLAAGPVWPEEG